MNEKTAILFQLGPVTDHGQWHDYLQYGFGTAEVPELLNLVSDKTLHEADANSNEVWVPLHAWRALGQIKSPLAVAPLIALFEFLCEDAWAISELGIVLGMIGEPAIESLLVSLEDNCHAEIARIMALDGLTEVAKQHPECRDRIVEIFRGYMTRPDTSATGLNGLLLGRLIDLEAVELIDDIRRIFEMECVDIGCAGDLEDVEIALGLRNKRSTPKPNYGMLNRIPPKPPEESDDLYAMIDYYFDRYGNDDSLLDAAELDGFITAIACSPEIILPSHWLPAIWGGDQLSPEWASINEAKAFTQLVTAFYNQVTSTLRNDEFDALFHERDVDGRTYFIVDGWCEGFIRGIQLWHPLSPIDRDALEMCLLPIRTYDFDPTVRVFLCSIQTRRFQDLPSR